MFCVQMLFTLRLISLWKFAGEIIVVSGFDRQCGCVFVCLGLPGFSLAQL